MSKEMLDEELRRTYRVGKILGFATSHDATSRLMTRLGAKAGVGKDVEGLDCGTVMVPSRHGGRDIRARVYRPVGGGSSLPAMLYIHGGGYVGGKPEDAGELIRGYIDAVPCVVVAPDYRLAYEAPYPAAFDDCVDTLRWMAGTAPALGVRDDRFIVAGHSAGGGLTAAVTEWSVRSREVAVAFQMPIFPMIDDRPTPSNTGNDAPVWNSRSNALGWGAYLKGLTEIPATAAPARVTDFAGYPPTITYVGDVEAFHDETVAYVTALRDAGVPVEFEVFPGAYHGFVMIAADTSIARRALAFEREHLKGFVERYF